MAVTLSDPTWAAMSEASRSIGYLDGVHRGLFSDAGTWAIATHEAVASATIGFGEVNVRKFRDAFVRREYALDMDDAATAAAGGLQALVGLTPQHVARWDDNEWAVVGSVVRGQRSVFRQTGSPIRSTAFVPEIVRALKDRRVPPMVQAAIATMVVAASAPEDPCTGILARHLGLAVLARAGGCVDLRFPPVSMGLLAAPGSWDTIAHALVGPGSADAARLDAAMNAYFKAIAHATHAAGYYVESAARVVSREGGSARTRKNELTRTQERVLDLIVGLPALSMRQLVALTGLTPRTLTRIVEVLAARDAIVVREKPDPEWTVVRARKPFGIFVDSVKFYPVSVGAPWPEREDWREVST
ncbi:MarR family transcriptional regulator [Demequina phytophila]|uniref:MarR family transcriptional regulator n=1 Tax=Demequina phytophila TaxID=1638981 RepID=UPI0012E0401A|nr:helix-turn-helix domain-containing protein [Demequina phytophila]